MFDNSIAQLQTRLDRLRQTYEYQLNQSPMSYVRSCWDRIKAMPTLPIYRRYTQLVKDHGPVSPMMTAELAEVAYPTPISDLTTLGYHIETTPTSPFADGLIRRAVVPSTEGQDIAVTDAKGNLIAIVSFLRTSVDIGPDYPVYSIRIRNASAVQHIDTESGRMDIYLEKPVVTMESSYANAQ